MADASLHVPAMPIPGERYDAENEVAFRRQVADLALAIESLVIQVAYTPYGEMHMNDSTDTFVIDTTTDHHAFSSADLMGDHARDWTFNAGKANVAITGIAAGSVGGDIEVTTGAAHELVVGYPVSQVGLANGAYVGYFLVEKIISSTKYEVTAVYTATGTGVMDKPSALLCGAGAQGTYMLHWNTSAASVGANVVFQFFIHAGASILVGTKTERKFGTAGDVGSMGGTSLVTIAQGDYVSFALANTTNATDIDFVDFNLNLVRVHT